MDVVLVIICTLVTAVLLGVVVYKAIALIKEISAGKQTTNEVRESENCMIDIVQNDKTVKIACSCVDDSIDRLADGEKEE